MKQIVIVSLQIFGAVTAFCDARGVVVPGSLANVEASSGSKFPFDVNEGRMQQIYGAPEFGSEAGWIREFYIRMDQVPNAPSLFTTLSNIQVSFSTTLRPIDSLSPVFVDNVGLDVATVFSGSLEIAGRQFHLPGRPNFFEVGFTLQNRFFYDPGQGNLLLDIQKFPGGLATSSGTTFDAANTPGDSASGLFAPLANASVGTPSTLGLVTYFVIDPVPEPSSALLFLTGLGVLVVLQRFRRIAKH